MTLDIWASCTLHTADIPLHTLLFSAQCTHNYTSEYCTWNTAHQSVQCNLHSANIKIIHTAISCFKQISLSALNIFRNIYLLCKRHEKAHNFRPDWQLVTSKCAQHISCFLIKVPSPETKHCVWFNICFVIPPLCFWGWSVSCLTFSIATSCLSAQVSMTPLRMFLRAISFREQYRNVDVWGPSPDVALLCHVGPYSVVCGIFKCSFFKSLPGELLFVEGFLVFSSVSSEENLNLWVQRMMDV